MKEKRICRESISMKLKFYLPGFVLGVFCLMSCAGFYGSVEGGRVDKRGKDMFVIQNTFLSRSFSVKDGRFCTVEVVNKRASQKIVPLDCDEFLLRLSEGTHTTGTDVVLTARDFKFVKCDPGTLEKPRAGKKLSFILRNEEHGLTVAVHYELETNAFYLRKYLAITSDKPVTLERIDVDVITAADAYQPYQMRQIYARGSAQWRPGLGQPLMTSESGTFWGVEFPAADNFVKDNTIHCGYLWGRQIQTDTAYRTYAAVLGVADDPAYVSDAFYDYIGKIRIRPLRLQTQYNSWFDTGGSVNKQSFAKSVKKVHQELVVKRGNPPLKAYVIDDGWQDVGKNADWSDKVWTVNRKFESDFAYSFKAVRQADSRLGLWLSPGCNFGARPMVPKLKAQGFEALENYMSLAGPKYMQLLEDRMVELAAQGVSYFKLDGLFGHLNTRDFDIYGDKHGLPYMPQLGLEGLTPSDKRLNDAKYDELKIYYLTAGTEKLIDLFHNVAAANPDVYIVISNGAWLSPWWLMHVDAVWMINAGDAAKGSGRTEELVYRDGVYYDIWRKEHTHYPMNSLFNHEPKKTRTGEDEDVFRKYLYMNMSRGTGFVELYIKTFKLSESDWDVLSEGLRWVRDVFPTFKRSRMHGGDPRQGQVYGFCGWNAEQGYVSIHNPSDQKQVYTFTLDRAFGLVPDSGTFHLSSPMADSLTGLREQYSYGETISVTLEPKEIRILNFDKKVRDWSE